MRMRKFTFLEWYYTRSLENLFDLAPEDYYVYALIVKGAP